MRRAVRNVLGAGAAVLCLGGLLSACGGDSGDGYVATGPAGASPERAPGKTVGPSGDVKLVPLDAGGDGAKGDGKRGGGSGTPSGAGAGGAGSASGAGDTEGKSPGGKGGSDAADPAGPAGPTGGAPSSGRSPGGSGDSGRTKEPSGTPSRPGTDRPTTPSGPAKLAVGDPERKPADKRWCEKVTVAFHNTGGSPVRSGTVTFGTHIIGALGVDWATIESTVELPAPIGPGQKKEKTWPVCVDAWRVPLGMHVETRDVSVDWK
ncbi:hypothetical protein [Streptomyces formicae]|uniref:Secreted protein n=1 Tax=Streptomyces formicae TaxID=1616117 RepID=A0A291QB68_9ACTN|nr:hypothetical protein [Streptomyces formicae]ATL28949.1 hypothetical protein KY5_3931 [Streptomyces formicae]